VVKGGFVPRVLVSRFGAIARLGLHAFLEEEGFEVIEPECGSNHLLSRLSAERPDVVVIDLDSSGAQELARRIAASHPTIRVIACSAEYPTMRVYPPFHNGESYESDLSSALLAEAVRG
jgi:DNA-binding NarL/FixJ family response regulator